jgi:ABC-type glycerol-3-phosphate transport system substrate-binding protein
MTRHLRLSVCAAALAALTAGPAAAGCGIAPGNVSILGNDFPALQAIAAAVQACAGDGVTVTTNLTREHRDLQVPALTANPAQYTVAVVANGSLVPLLNADLVRPLDDLVAAYGQGLRDSQLIRVGGQIVAVAFMANAQHMFYRADILEQAGVQPPETLEDMLAAAEAIRAQGLMQHPVAIVSGAGWNLGQEFNNLFLGFGGQFFEPGSAAPAINGPAGVAALEALRALTSYSDPDFLTFDSNAVQARWESGQVALALLWGSRAAGVLDAEGSTPEIVAATRLAGAPVVAATGRPATTLWWDGFTIARNVSDADAAASFQAMMAALAPANITANSALAVWLAEGYQPTPASVGVTESVARGAAPYPMVPYIGLMHTALGENLAPFLQGTATAEETLATVEAAYITAARAQGFLN